MTQESLITIVGTIFTIIGTVITIWQANQARTYKNQIKSDIRKINLSTAIDCLRKAQNEIRRLPISLDKVPRGIKSSQLIHDIRVQFDASLGVLGTDGPDKDIRNILSDAQTKLNSYETSWNRESPNPQDVFDLQTKVQDAISLSNNRIYSLEGKA